MNDRPVYSTATGRATKEKKQSKDAAYKVSEGPTKVRLETKGRGGKAVSVLFNMPFEEKDAKRLMKDLQTLLGVGATFKNGAIELRGDVREKLAAIFADRGWKLVRAGG